MTERSGGRSASVVVLAVRRGVLAFAAIAGVAEGLALLVWAFGGTGISLADALALGWLEIGAAHHVALHLEIRDLVTAEASRIDVTVGVALASATLFTVWLLARAGRAVADATGGAWPRRLGVASLVAVAYAAPFVALLPLARVETAGAGDAVPAGVFRLSAVTWQAVVFPLAIALAAGLAGAVASLVATRPRGERVRDRAETSVRAAGRMLLVAFVATFAGLFVGGVLDPDGPIALTTPTTARYVETVGERPARGAVAVAHHLAVAPAEATWAFVPSMGGCIVVRGSADGDLLCLSRFPAAVTSEAPADEHVLSLPVGDVGTGDTPAPYLAFLLAPAVATIAGGLVAGRSVETAREAVVRGALAGALFAVAVAAMSVLSTVSVSYRSDVAGRVTEGSFVVGPDPVAALALGAVWGVAGGVLGAWLSRRARRR